MSRGAFDVWHKAVIASLLQSKADGLAFDEAWLTACRRYPPRIMELGPRRPQLDDEPCTFEFIREQAKAAWDNDRQELRDLPDALHDIARNWPARSRATSGRIMAGLR